MGEDGARDKDWLRARGITCVLQTQISSFRFASPLFWRLIIMKRQNSYFAKNVSI